MSKLKPVGHLQVIKVYEDGSEEVHFDEQNVIVSGMGVGLAHLFAGSGASNIRDFQVLNFQVGTGGSTAAGTYGYWTFKLTTPISEANYESAGSESLVENLEPIENGVKTSSTKAFVRIPYSNIQKVRPTTVRFNLILDRNTANGLSTEIDEVGLFMRNPRGLNTPSPILVAYRPFTGLTKTSTFSLLFKWTITF
jgi:hypothetical protein